MDTIVNIRSEVRYMDTENKYSLYNVFIIKVVTGNRMSWLSKRLIKMFEWRPLYKVPKWVLNRTDEVSGRL